MSFSTSLVFFFFFPFSCLQRVKTSSLYWNHSSWEMKCLLGAPPENTSAACAVFFFFWLSCRWEEGLWQMSQSQAGTSISCELGRLSPVTSASFLGLGRDSAGRLLFGLLGFVCLCFCFCFGFCHPARSCFPFRSISWFCWRSCSQLQLC